ncbi:sugar phosphate isomerase/epimerase [Microbacteriaceae bacterium VKM Ac-2854]|nr:sugar phosphate isomerase/epimerase [Microbacteriaceae bacterium VKM Ac-2854]
MTTAINRVGTDVKFTNGATLWGSGPDALRYAASAGLEGVNVRTLDELSPTLDTGELRDFAQLAAELDLYVEMGVGKVNPYMTAELPRVRSLGEGSYLLGMQRMIETCAAFGWSETWTAVGGFKPYPGIFFTDRFRTDADWTDQLAATEEFLLRLAPTLRATGVRLNLETHEELTTFELIRLIEAVGDDVLGICLDPGNLAVRAEPPLEGIARIAPYVRTTQLRDAALWRNEDGTLSRFLAPCGEGVIDWSAALDLLLTANPGINLTIEGIGGVRAEMKLHVDDPTWQVGHPDLTPAALAELYRLADGYHARAEAALAPTAEQLRERVDPVPAHNAFVAASAAHLRERMTARAASFVPTLSKEN